MARNRADGAATLDGPGVARHDGPPAEAGGYTVVARRYRPQGFEDVVGQDHVVQALRNAIRLNRVTHAYLFSGTRGVGKTSMARIFAKCLNCAHGPTDAPCNECDICRAIGAGQDVDVIEIDGASNNGVEQVRELRQNAGLRPSRSRFKIYYIDEVHMLSTGAFNALLKTLEEPPEHVKFFFATTEPGKIPVTVLSRCQRYDFAGIRPEAIVESLAEICRREAVEADRDALAAVARRASGSMRDAQSLLEQLISTGGARLTAEVVHRSLGTAPDDRLRELVEAMARHDPGAALRQLEATLDLGVQPGEVLAGLLECLRDAMVLAVPGAAEVPLTAVAPGDREHWEAIAKGWGLTSILAALGILEQARGRLRGSPHGRLIAEAAVVRVAVLEDFAELGELVGRLQALEGGGPSPPSPRKKAEPVVGEAARPAADGPPRRSPTTPPPSPTTEAPRDADDLRRRWPAIVEAAGPDLGSKLEKLRPKALTPDRLVLAVPTLYNWVADALERPDDRSRVETLLRRELGLPVALVLERESSAEPREPARPAPRADALAADPLVKLVSELFEARPVHVDVGEEPPGP